MAQTGYTPIVLYASGTATNTPIAGNLASGELAINYADGKLFYKDSSGVVQVLATKDATSGSFTNLAYTGTLTGGTGVVNLGSGQFYKDASGNVGIGTASPSQKLSISGRINFAGFSTNVDDYGLWATSAEGTTIASYSTTNICFRTNSTERMRIDSSGNVIVAGTTATNTSANRGNITLNGTSSAIISIGTGGSEKGYIYTQGTDLIINADTGNLSLSTAAAQPITFSTNATEAMRIDSSGNLLVGLTSGGESGIIKASAGNGIGVTVTGAGGSALNANYTSTGTGYYGYFKYGGTLVGSISSTGTITVYATTSDYRLKTVIAPVSDSGQRIDALEPIEYDWNTGGRTKGFLAHKFAEVYPNSVTGEKDAVDAEGKPVYQGMQASTPEVMADLIAEIQSLRKRVALLESK